MRRHSAEQVYLDKDSNGLWMLTYRPTGDETLCLRVEVGGPWDWYGFRAELHRGGAEPSFLGTFDVAPIELIHEHAPRYIHHEDVEPWNPWDEPDFLQIPEVYQDSFAVMVRTWAHLAGTVVPGPAAARTTTH